MEITICEHEPRGPCLYLGIGLCQPNFVGARIDGEEEIALLDDVPILEVYCGKCAPHLGAEFKVVDRRKLSKEAQPGMDLAHERLAHHHFGKGRRSRRRSRIALTIRIG